MPIGTLDPLAFRAILPEILIFILGIVVLAVDLVLPERRRSDLGYVTAVGLLLALLVSVLFGLPGSEAEQFWGGMVRFDGLGFAFKMLFLFGAAMTALFAIDFPHLGQRGEFYLLLLASTLGMCFMASATDLIMLFLAIELTSIPLYVMAGFLIREDRSAEAGFKYLLFGAMTSSIMVYGFSLLYGFSGVTNLYEVSETVGRLLATPGQAPLVLLSLILLLVGFAFKISVVPFHFWAPDVYEGAPTPVTGFLSTASKAAGFAVLMRVMIIVFPDLAVQWGAILAAVAVATMTLGNLLALAQKNLKRMLAYSSIAHAGYALIGVVALSELGIASVVFYMIVYVVTNLAAFGAVAAFSRVSGSDDIMSFAGLSRRSPALAFAMLVSFLSLAGMPPLGGFVIKFFVFAAAIQSQLIWLAVVGVLNAIVGLYYYLTVLKVVYLYRGENDDQPIPLSRPITIGLVTVTLGIVVLGTIFGPWFNWAAQAASAMF